MKYYSELLDKMFDTEKDLLRAENEHKEIKSVELNDQIESILEQMYALDVKSDELDEKLHELDDEYYDLTGNSWFEDVGISEMLDIRERAKKGYVVEIMGVVHVDPNTMPEIGCVCCPTGPKGEPGVPVESEPKSGCCDCDCDCNTPAKETIKKAVKNDFFHIIEKEFPILAQTLRDYTEDK